MDGEVARGEVVVGNLSAIDADALIGAVEMGRGIEAGAEAGGGEDGRKCGGSGTFAVGACDKDAGKALLGIAEVGQQDADLGERKLAARAPGLRVKLRGQGVQCIDGRGVGHGKFKYRSREQGIGSWE